MGSKRILVRRLDPTIKTTSEEVALVIEQGNRYLEFLTSKRKKLYETCATIDDFLEANALQGISYDKFSGASNLNPDSILRILEVSEHQLKESQQEFKDSIFLLAQEEEKYFLIFKAFCNLPVDDARILEAFYAEGREANEIVKEFKPELALATFWKKKSAALRKVADNCRYQPLGNDWEKLKRMELTEAM